MITKKDLESAIAECQGKRDPDARTCMMRAACYTIKREMFGEEKEVEHFSYAHAPDRNIIDFDGDSEFARAVDGKLQEKVLPVLEELMETLRIIQPRLYNVVMERLG